jgi:hypothetical protein
MFVQVVGTRGYGGAVYVMSGRVILMASTLRENLAKSVSSSTAWHASGGAAAVSDGGTLELFGAQMHRNDAGGKGLYETIGSFKATSDNNRKARAAHIDCAGTVILADSKISSAVSGGDPDIEQLAYSASALIVGNGAGAITLRDCLFESAVADTVLLRLVGSDSRSVIRGCTAVNTTVDVPGDDTGLSADMRLARFAVVNCTFEPPLPALPAALQPPRCSAIVAGERVCDPRAACQPKETGGVQCFCVGADGLQDRPGVFPDGRQCQQATQVDAYVQSRTIIVRAQKPGNYSEKLTVTVRVDGETSFGALYSMGITHYLAHDGHRTNVTWPSIHDQSLALNGFALIWDTPPSSDAQLQLNADASQSTATKSYAFVLQLDCAGLDGKGQRCVADGDRVEAVMQIGSPLDLGGMRSEVRITTEVAALVSCQRTRVWVDSGAQGVRASSAIVVRLRAVDVDALPIDQTRAEVEFRFGNRTVPVNWNRGSNEYVASVPAELTGQAGEYELVVTATHGWDEDANQQARCVLLRRKIQVDEGFNSSLVLAISLSCCVVCVVGLVMWVRRRSEQLRHILTMVLTEVGKLIMSICFELGDLATDVRLGRTRQAASRARG